MNASILLSKQLAFPVWFVLCLSWLVHTTAIGGESANVRINEEDADKLITRLAELNTRLVEANKKILRMQELVGTNKNAVVDDAAMAEQLAAVRAANEEKRQACKQLAEDVGKPPEKRADIAQRLGDIANECNEVVQEIAMLKAAEDGKTGLGFNAAKRVVGKEVLPLVLVNGRVVPGWTPYFSFQVVQGINNGGQQVLCQRVKRVQNGVTVADAIKDDGLIDQILKDKKADSGTHVFNLFVCADSIGSFHQLRQAISKKGYSYGWDTSEDKEILQALGGGGGGIDISN